MEVGDIMQDLILEPKYTIVLKVQLVILLVIVQAALVFKHLHMDWVVDNIIIVNIRHHQDQIQLILLEMKWLMLVLYLCVLREMIIKD